jgi:hypothetical protein
MKLGSSEQTSSASQQVSGLESTVFTTSPSAGMHDFNYVLAL